MKRYFFGITIIFILPFFLSCNSKAKDEEKATIKLKEVEKLISENNYELALLKIDSIDSLFPLIVSKRKIAAAFKDTIMRRESAKVLQYSLSILPQKLQQLDSLQKNFKFEKDEIYQEFGNYVYKTLITEQNTSRNYLKSYIDENADFYLISNVVGSKINHSHVKIYSNDLFIETEPISKKKGCFYSFTDDGYWESLTFKNDAENGLSAFINEHKAEQLKVELKGSRSITYYLSEQDKEALSTTYQLWLVKRDVKKLQSDIEKAMNRIGMIKLRHKK